jgi:hypothetical protein
VNVEVECLVSNGKSTNPVIVNLSNDLCWIWVKICKILCFETWNSFMFNFQK